MTQGSSRDASAVSTASEDAQGLSIGEYLIRRLRDYGIDDLFGIPGDYILSFYSMLEQSEINVVGCTREECAGFAADTYARIHGMGAVCVTYCVGGLSLCNSVAGAYAEKSPVVVISGSPGMNERINNPLLHHKVRTFRTQMEVFERICVAGTELNNSATAFREIDRVLEAAARWKRPVYIELPRDMVQVVPPSPYTIENNPLVSDSQACAEAVSEVAELLSQAQRPLILAGVEIHRFGLQDRLLELAEPLNLPIAATLLSKSVISETHPLYVGVYEGGMSEEKVTQFVEESDCILMLGTFMTDINLGIFTANLDPEKCIDVTSEQLRISRHHYHDVLLGDFLKELTAAAPRVKKREIPPLLRAEPEPFLPKPDAPITITRSMQRLNELLDENTIVITDIGDSLFAAVDLSIRGRTEFISPAYYTTMGFSVPASLGAAVARPEARVVTICGDGAFHMTGSELSSLIRRNANVVILLMDNGGYGTERLLHSGDWDYNEIPTWNYALLPEVYGGGTGYLVTTEGEFEQAITTAWADSGVSLIQIKLAHDDFSPTIHRLAERLGRRV